MSRFYGTVQQVLPKTQIKTVIVTNIKDYMSPLLAFLFGLTMEKKGGDRVQLAPGHERFKDVLAKYTAAQRPKVTVTADDKALFQYSGGTTGVPKAAVALHRNMVANTVQIDAWLSQFKAGTEAMLLAIP